MYRLEQTKKGNHIMEQTLPPVFDARRSLLKRNNLKFYRLNEAMIHRSSWAAMDFVESGDIDDFDLTENPNFKSDPLYLALHEQYELPFSIAESGLVMDLAMWHTRKILQTALLPVVANSHLVTVLTRPVFLAFTTHQWIRACQLTHIAR